MKSSKNNGILGSFRFELVLSSLFAMIATLLTEAGIACIIALIYRMLNRKEPSNLPGNSLNSANNYGFAAGNSPYGMPQESAGIDPELLIGAGIAAVGLGVILFIFYFMIVTRRYSLYLTEIVSGINRMSTGDLESRIEIRSDDELGEIAESLNRMADEIKGLMDQERRTESTKNQLITSVAHDLRTPLTSILGYLELAKEEELESRIRQKYITIAYDKSKRLEKLIEDLFSFTKLSSGEIRMNIRPFDLVKLMEQLADEFYPSFQENHIEYEFSTDRPTLMMEADADLLARAFANLIGNAVKYGAAGKNIRIGLKEKTGRAVVTVTNYGELIPEKDLKNIFNRFYRVENSRSAETGGSGLGLAIARSIVERHHGTIQVKSDFDGTVFTVMLPLNCRDTIE